MRVKSRYPLKFKERREVTIAIGLLATDGIVLAADTQTGADYLKISDGKISMSVVRAFTDPATQRSFGITGAGNANYLEGLRSRMRDRFAENQDQPLDSLDGAFQGQLRDFYTDFIVPFDRYPSEERPEIWTILAAQHDARRLLWSTEKNLLTPHLEYAAVGVGAMYAKILLRRTYQLVDCDTASLLAAYVIFQTKETIDGCGHDTDIFVLHRDGPWLIEKEEIRELEAVFREYMEAEGGILLRMLGHDAGSGTTGPQLAVAKEKLRAILQRRIRP